MSADNYQTLLPTPYEEYSRGGGPVAPTWLSGVKAVARSVAGVLPALLLVLLAGVLALLGLVCDQGRRTYALSYADRFIDLAAVLVGRPLSVLRRGNPTQM
jgi:hypothetical protein